AWKALADLRLEPGDEAGSRDAARRHLAATVPHPELVQAADHLYRGELARAETICREFLKQHPINVTAIRMLAEAGMRLGALQDAQALLERCLALAPDFHLARHTYAELLYRRQRYEAALDELATLRRVDPDHVPYQLLEAAALVHVNEHQRAIGLYEGVLGRNPRLASAQMSYGHALKTVGRQADAVRAYRAGIEARPQLGEAYWSLANLKTFRFDDAEVDTMRRAVETAEPGSEDAYHLCFALGKALEDRGDYDASFEYYRRGNAARRRSVVWDADEHHRDQQRLITFFSRERVDALAGAGCPAADPIFIVGLPRSGSTLLEQILASHSQVEGTAELPDIIAIARRLSGKRRRRDPSRYPEVLAELSADALRALGDEYLARTRIQRVAGLPRFIDKMPNNFSHVGLIHLILPNATIIDARRSPLSCCFSVYKQLFARGQGFSYDLTELGRYYRDYEALMAHWDRVLPGRVLRVDYEAVVGDLEGQVRRLLAHCGLPFEPGCLEFHRTERAVRTASSEQVRRPLYGDALDVWRHYESHLDELKAALALESWGRAP
ncbi:MAG: sulfotransferase, partial [Pseudomonadales bacterium]